jgi:hypothetical protein
MLEETKQTAQEIGLVNGLMIYLWVIGLSLWGGMVSYFEKKEKFNAYNFTAHLASSGFAGLMVYLGCSYAGITGPLQGVLCGFGGYIGTNTLVKLAMRLKAVRAVLVNEKEESNGQINQ